MAVNIEKIYYSAIREYQMELLGGEEGLWNSISWIHIVEVESNAEFLKGEELVLYTGILRQKGNELINFAKEIKKAGATGLVINIGPYIESVPQELIDFANENAFPVFTLPWNVKLVEFARRYCAMIIREEEADRNMCSAFRGVILSPENEDEYATYFSKHEVFKTKKYCMIKCLPDITISNDEQSDYTKIYYSLRQIYERIVSRYKDDFVIFRFDNYLTVVIPDTDRQECEEIILKIADKTASFIKIKNEDIKLHFAVSRNSLKLNELSFYYDKLSTVCRLMKKSGEKIRFWDDLGTWELILSIGDDKRLKEFRKTNIGILEKYDNKNGTEYCHILDVYLEEDANMPNAAEKCHVHRNTFAYHLKKISEMIDCDLRSTEDRSRLYIAFRIKELMEL
ncbi:MAG: PucR family transcriptional regulator ligand-binding domain-containing protein [Lachnospiraceae bacterium]|nr:PucR family transcriptional regulator ligand-binding domain-containing protein [Lachnospiraceae bacterium]